MYPELLIYLAIRIFSNSTITWWSANKKSMIDLQKSKITPCQNVEQECMKLLMKQYNAQKTNDFPYQIYYIYR